jgi:hypothetical protein
MKTGSHSFSSALSDASATVMHRPYHDAYEDARARLVQSLNTSSEMSSAPQQRSILKPQSLDAGTTPKAESATDSLNAGTKRKRESEHEPVDFTQNTVVMPPPRRRPVAASQPHTSADGAEAGRVKSEGSSYHPSQGTVDPYRQQKIERVRQKRLAALPEGVIPAKPEQVGFGPGAASDYAVRIMLFNSALRVKSKKEKQGADRHTMGQRSQYFSNMKKTDVLNLLSFCDQLKPQLLVDVMVSVSKRHPDLPMFSSPDWDAGIPSEPRSPKTQHSSKQRGPLSSRSRHGPSLLNSKAKHKIRGSNVNHIQRAAAAAAAHNKPLKRSRLAEEVVVEEEHEAEEVDEDAPPPTWPKAGEGLYARLVPETQDASFLADINDEEAFSHFMVDKMGRQIVDPI